MELKCVITKSSSWFIRIDVQYLAIERYTALSPPLVVPFIAWKISRRQLAYPIDKPH